MANRRMISSGYFEDEFTGELNYLERLLWIGLIVSIADDQGRMYDSTALIRAKVFLYDDIKDEQVESALNKLAKANKIIRYEKEGKNIIQIVKWWIYQTPSWASPSKYPAPDKWTDRTKYHAKGNEIIKQDWDKEGGLPNHKTINLHSELPKQEGVGIDSAINDVKGDVNVKVNCNDDVEVTNNNPTDLIKTFTGYTKLKAGKGAKELSAELVNAGVTNEDIISAVDFLNGSDKYKCVRFLSIKESVITEMNKRKVKEKIPDPEDPRRYIKGEYGEIGSY